MVWNIVCNTLVSYLLIKSSPKWQKIPKPQYCLTSISMSMRVTVKNIFPAFPHNSHKMVSIKVPSLTLHFHLTPSHYYSGQTLNRDVSVCSLCGLCLHLLSKITKSQHLHCTFKYRKYRSIKSTHLGFTNGE